MKSNSIKKLVIVGDVPYTDKYSSDLKNLASKKIIFTGYITCQNELSQLYKNCFGYIHGHQFGGTNPTMINALDLNCQIIALDTVFNREMLKDKKVIFFKKNILSIINSFTIFENKIQKLESFNSKYKIPDKYSWNEITNKYEKVFLEI